jgi:hypothetical protein
MKAKILNGTGKDAEVVCTPQEYCWRYSGARGKMNKEMKYRGWCEEFTRLTEEAFSILREIESKCKVFVKYDWEARVPNCS